MQTIHANDSSICASFSFFHSCQSRSIGLVGSCVIDQRLIRTQHLNTLNSFKYSFQMCHDGGVVNLQCQCCHNLSTLFLSDKGTDFSVFMPQEHPHLIKIKHFRKSCPSLLSLLADIGKTTKTTSTTYNNAFDKSCAKPSSLEFCHGEKGYHGMEPESQTSLLKGKQQRTTFAAAFSGKAARPCCGFLLI